MLSGESRIQSQAVRASLSRTLMEPKPTPNEAKASSRNAQVRRAPRIEGRHHAIAVDSAGRTYDVTVVDISSGGFRIETEETFRTGEYITLRVARNDDFPTQILWTLGKEAGGMFLEPVALPYD